jgi:hypothetical protein
LAEIVDWINRPPAEEEHIVYWLYGVAGCGKSAIASTIAEQFRSIQRCATFLFDASKLSQSPSERLFSTLSRQLADLDPQWKNSLTTIARESWELRTTLNVKDQFENFILRPAKDFKPVGPTLFVIDGLDESGSQSQRKQLLQVLSRLDELKERGHFRFLITSRPEEDIQNAFGKKPWTFARNLSENSEDDHLSTDNDIRRYVDSELSGPGTEVLLQKLPDKPWLALFVDRAQHLFQWAYVACEFVKGTNSPNSGASYGVYDRFTYLRDYPAYMRLSTLDVLYTTILHNLFGLEEDAEEVIQFRVVLRRILALQEPLSLHALTEMWPEEEKKRHVRQVLRPLSSLLGGVDKEDEPIWPLHSSFIDFLSDSNRSKHFYVKSGPEEDMALAISSLRVMNRHLQFNICCLESSFQLNHEIEDLALRLEQYIPRQLSYSCRYFALHLNKCVQSPTILSKLKSLAEELLYNKLFNWLEVLSLLGDVSCASTSLPILRAWLQVCYRIKFL